ncbi:class I SAM-dependent methyltransferase [Microbacterium sp. Mu-80]|uniref:Class I SAM-dependent methyltransferase n=1 Tax=Microbacterium bandirmense TaxID=3122050 RepID=A0ABU8LAT9_9MICO
MPDSEIAAAYGARAGEYIALAGDLEQMAEEDRALIAGWRDATTGRLLDAGCGPGHWAQFLHAGDSPQSGSAGGSRAVLGIDLSAEFIANARSRYPHLEFVEGSFTELPVADASHGGILAWYSLIHTPPEELPPVFAEFARVLAPGGSVLIGFFDGTPREQFAHAVTTAYFWTSDALAELLESAGFTVTASERRGRAPGEVSIRPHASLTAARR